MHALFNGGSESARLAEAPSLLVFIPIMTSSEFRIMPCELSDMSECVDIFDEAFATDPAVLYLYPHCDPKVLKENSLKGYEKSYTAPGTKYFKAVNKRDRVRVSQPSPTLVTTGKAYLVGAFLCSNMIGIRLTT
jgi:hypothetical protein